MTKRTSAAALLAAPSPLRRKLGPVDTWLKEHPAALAFLREWTRMRDAGETSWGARSVLHHLRTTWGYPFTAYRALDDWATRYKGGKA